MSSSMHLTCTITNLHETMNATVDADNGNIEVNLIE